MAKCNWTKRGKGDGTVYRSGPAMIERNPLGRRGLGEWVVSGVRGGEGRPFSHLARAKSFACKQLRRG